ncbi:hypothetical protein CSUI_004800, partial [Cystoisospora suis]
VSRHMSETGYIFLVVLSSEDEREQQRKITRGVRTPPWTIQSVYMHRVLHK